MAIKFDRFQVENVHFEQVKLPNNETIVLPRYNGKEIPHIRLPRIELTCYGVPKLGKYFKTDKDRQFLQLPIQQEVLARFELLDSLMRCSSELQHWMNGAQYVPIVRQGSQGPYIKLKLAGSHCNMHWKANCGPVQLQHKVMFDIRAANQGVF